MSKLSSKTNRSGSSRKSPSRRVSRSMAKVSGGGEPEGGATEGELIAEVKRSEASLSKKDMPSMQGIGLAPKLMLHITLVTAIVTLMVGYLIASAMRGYLTDEILKSGVDGVRMLSSYGHTSIKIVGGSRQSFENVREFTEEMKKVTAGAHLGELVGEQLAGLESPIMDCYITLEELGKESKILSLQSKNGGVKIDWGESVLPSDVGKIDIREAIFSRDGQGTPVYVFESKIDIQEIWPGVEDSSYRPTAGKVRLFLSTAKVKESSDNVFMLTAMVLAGAVMVSLLIAWFLARGITRPVLRLVKDMSMVAAGDLDHETESKSTDEIGYLSTTFNQLTKTLKIAHEAEIEKEKLEHDLSVGREIQQTLLPKTLYKIPGYDLDAFYMSAKEVGGDYYDLIPVDKTKLGVVVADVSGKGIQGAMIMTIMRTVMNIAAVGNLSSKNCLARTNRFLSDRIKRGMFVTAYYAILDCRKHTLSFSSAGHNPMVIYRARTKTLDLLNPTGIALGFDKGPLFERTLKESETSLGPGDRFVLYTDGVVEAMNEEHEEYTDQKFYDFVMAHAEEDSKTFVHKLVSDVKKHQGKAPQHDDITIVTFRKT
jgi:HAMP domain-containing protein